VEFRVDGIEEISWWILGYGDQVEVLSPAVLRKRTAQTAKR
jgi:predicted DNA-binding transcriptional regulator YafY